MLVTERVAASFASVGQALRERGRDPQRSRTSSTGSSSACSPTLAGRLPDHIFTRMRRHVQGCPKLPGFAPNPTQWRQRLEHRDGRCRSRHIRLRMQARHTGHWSPGNHSARRAIIGSSLPARRAGITEAASAARKATTATTTSVSGSYGLTP